MKRKMIVLALVALLAIVCVGCGSAKQSEPETSASTSVDTVDADQAPVVTEKTVDAVADALGLTDKGEVYFSMVGASDGAEFNGGAVEVYIFDESSDDYKAAIDGTGMIKAAAYKDGVIVSFPEGTEPDQALIDAFNALTF